MEFLEGIVVIRGIERILIVIFSGISLILGWSLFKVGILKDQAGEIGIGNIFIKFQKVGPGIFFALFGTIVFIYIILSPFTYKETKANKEEKNIFEVSYLSKDQTKYLTLAKSINTLRDTIEILPKDKIPSNELELMTSAISNLEKERNAWVVSLYGLKNFQSWLEMGDNFLLNPENVPQELRPKLETIKPWMAHSLPE